MHNHSRNSTDRRKQSPDWDPYLVSIVNDCKGRAAGQVSENTAVVLDELGTTATRRRAVLLQLRRNN